MPVPTPARTGSCGAGVVGDRDDQRVALAAHAHLDPRAGRVAERVGQALLDDMAGGLDGGRREPLALALEPERDGEPAAGRARDELLDQREVGRRGERAVLPQQGGELAHVGLRLARGAGDRRERLRGQLRVAGEPLPGARPGRP